MKIVVAQDALNAEGGVESYLASIIPALRETANFEAVTFRSSCPAMTVEMASRTSLPDVVLAMTTESVAQSSTPIWNSIEAAEYLRIHPRTLTRMARNGEIPSIQIGRLWRFRQSDLDAWLTRKVNSGPLSMPPQR